MEKGLGKVKTLVIVVLAILVTLVAVCGIYVKEKGVWKNLLPEYKYGMELSGYRELHFVLDDSEEEKEIYVDEDGNYLGDVQESTSDDGVNVSLLDTEGNVVEDGTTSVGDGISKETRVVKANPDEAVTIENFEKAKKIIQSRLDTVDLNEYNIRLNTGTGEIIVEVPDNGNISLEEALVTTVGKVSLIDHQTGLILMEDVYLKRASMLGGSTSDGSGYQIYLQLEYDKTGTELLKQISQKYITVVDDEGNETTEYIDIVLDDTVIMTTYFPSTDSNGNPSEGITTGMLQIPYGSSFDDYNEYYEYAQDISYVPSILNGDALPLKYVLSADSFINTSVSENTMLIARIVFAVAILAVSIVMIVKYKGQAVKYVACGVLYASLLSLVCRYTNVQVTFNSLVAYLCAIAINYCFYFKLLNKLKTNDNVKTALGASLKELYKSIIPVIIIAIIFTFVSSVVISSIGMILFWGLILQALLSLIALF